MERPPRQDSLFWSQSKSLDAQPISDLHPNAHQTLWALNPQDIANEGRLEQFQLPVGCCREHPRNQGLGRGKGGDQVGPVTLPVTCSGARVGGWLEGKSGFRGSVPWGMGQSLWALVNRSGNMTTGGTLNGSPPPPGPLLVLWPPTVLL